MAYQSEEKYTDEKKLFFTHPALFLSYSLVLRPRGRTAAENVRGAAATGGNYAALWTAGGG